MENQPRPPQRSRWRLRGLRDAGRKSTKIKSGLAMGLMKPPRIPRRLPPPSQPPTPAKSPKNTQSARSRPGALRWSWRSCRAESRRAVADTARQPRVQRSPRPSSAPPSGSSSSSRRASRRSLTRPGSRTPVAFLAAADALDIRLIPIASSSPWRLIGSGTSGPTWIVSGTVFSRRRVPVDAGGFASRLRPAS